MMNLENIIIISNVNNKADQYLKDAEIKGNINFIKVDQLYLQIFF